MAAVAAASTHAQDDRLLKQTADVFNSNSTATPAAGDATTTASGNYPQQQNWMLLAVISVAVLFVLVLSMVSFVLLRRRKKLKATEQLEYDVANDTTKVTQFTHGTLGTFGSGHTNGGYQPEFEYLPNDIRTDEEMQPFRLQQREVVRGRLIAKGGYGAVYRAKFRNETVVVKQLLPDKTRNKQILKSFMDEIRICAALDHPKIVRFIGVTWSSLLDLSVVMEFMANGDLGSLLTEQLQRQASGVVSRFDYGWFKTSTAGGAKCKSLLALDIAEALVYLHSFISPIIHRDLKSRNVLLSDDWEAKLTDFGVSRELDEDQTMTGEIGTVSWIAPEVLRGERYTEKADIYSFGVIMTELDTCRRPYSDGIPNEENNGGSNQHTNTRIAVLVSNGKLKPAITDDCPASVRQLIDQCLGADPTTRPSAVQLHFELRNLDMAEEEHRETQNSIFKRGNGGSGMRPTSSGASLAEIVQPRDLLSSRTEASVKQKQRHHRLVDLYIGEGGLRAPIPEPTGPAGGEVKKVTPAQKFMGGALSGVIEALILTPLDVTKTRLQLDKVGQYKGMVDCGKKLFQAEGARGLYKGFTPWTIHVVTKNGTRFYFNAIYRKLLADQNGQVSGSKEFLAGALAGATEAVLIVTPFEVIKTRMQGQNIVKGEVAKYGGPVQTTLTIIRNEGPLALWKGVAPTIGRQGLNQACSFWSNNAIKKHVWKLQEGDSLPAWKSGLTGMLGAIPGPCINCPMDVVKTRLMAQETIAGQLPKYTGMVQAMRVIAKEEGFPALYKGLVPRLTRLCPSYGIQWLVMDQATAYFSKN